MLPVILAALSLQATPVDPITPSGLDPAVVASAYLHAGVRDLVAGARDLGVRTSFPLPGPLVGAMEGAAGAG